MKKGKSPVLMWRLIVDLKVIHFMVALVEAVGFAQEKELLSAPPLYELCNRVLHAI